MLCRICWQRPAKVFSRYGARRNRGWKVRKSHDACRQCWRSLMDKYRKVAGMNLFGQEFTFSEDPGRGVITLRFASKPPLSLRDAARSCGFRQDGKDSLTWLRKLDSNGKAAAQYFQKDADKSGKLVLDK